jgi:hypothetical protein
MILVEGCSSEPRAMTASVGASIFWTQVAWSGELCPTTPGFEHVFNFSLLARVDEAEPLASIAFKFNDDCERESLRSKDIFL